MAEPRPIRPRDKESQKDAIPVERKGAAEGASIPVQPTGAPGEGESIRDLASELIKDVQDLVRAEVQRARREVSSDIKAWIMGGVWLAVGGVALLLGAVYVLLAVVFALALVMPAWLAALIVGVVVLVIGGILAYVGVQKFSTNPLPDESMRKAQEDAQWIKDKTS